MRFFSTSLETIESEKVSYSVVSSREIYVFVEELKKQKQICFDTETTSLNIQEAELVGISISYKHKQAFYIPTLNKKERKNVTSLLKPILENKSVVLIGHNLKYDVQIMKKYNINISQNVFDTMLAHYLISPETSHKLDSISESFLNHKTIPIEDIIGKKGVDQKNMKDIPVKDVYKYACEDADITFRLKSILEKKLCDFWEIDYVLCRESGSYSQKNWESIVSGSKMKLFLVQRPKVKNDYSYSFDQYQNLINHIIKKY